MLHLLCRNQWSDPKYSRLHNHIRRLLFHSTAKHQNDKRAVFFFAQVLWLKSSVFQIQQHAQKTKQKKNCITHSLCNYQKQPWNSFIVNNMMGAGIVENEGGEKSTKTSWSFFELFCFCMRAAAFIVYLIKSVAKTQGSFFHLYRIWIVLDIKVSHSDI